MRRTKPCDSKVVNLVIIISTVQHPTIQPYMYVCIQNIQHPRVQKEVHKRIKANDFDGNSPRPKPRPTGQLYYWCPNSWTGPCLSRTASNRGKFSDEIFMILTSIFREGWMNVLLIDILGELLQNTKYLEGMRQFQCLLVNHLCGNTTYQWGKVLI